MSRISLSLLAAGCLLGQDAKTPATWRELGIRYAEQKQYREAEPAFRRACQLDAKYKDSCYLWARTLYGLDRFEESLKALELANPHLWRVRLAMGQAAEALGDTARADREFHEALDLCGGQAAEPGNAYGMFLMRQGRTADAIPAFEAAVKADAKSPEAETNLGRALFETGRTEDAIPHLERAALMAPRSAQAHLLLAKAYVRAGREADAKEHFELAARYGTEK